MGEAIRERHDRTLMERRSMGPNPYEAPKASLVGGLAHASDRVDLREIAVLHGQLLLWLQMELGLLCLPMVLGVVVVVVVSAWGFPLPSVTFTPQMRLLAITTFFVLYVVLVVGILVAWVMGFLSSWRLCRRIRWTPIGWLLTVLAAVPIYGLPAWFVVNWMTSRYLRLQGVQSGWRGTRLDQFEES
jgi:hypothetical protein